ncbi:MAG: T9SS sorting signal type C domain-containing protein [Flavobacterium sp.]
MIQKLFLLVLSLLFNFFSNKKKLLFYTFLFTALGLGSGYGQTNTWTGTTSTAWDTATNWSLNLVPTTAHDVVIPNVTNKPTISVAGAVCNTLSINNILGGNTNALTITSPGTLVVTGAITMIAPTAGTINTTIAVGTGSLTAASVTMNDSGNDNLDCILSLSTGVVNISGNITMSGSTARNQVTFSGAGTLKIGGTMTGGGLTPSTGTVNYNNSGAQTVGAYTYNNLILSGSGTKTFGAITTVSGNWSMISGTLANLGGFTHTAGTLVLGGAGPLLSSWGSTASGATNTTNDYFTGTGRINVSSAPYPAIDNNYASYTSGVTGQVAGTQGEYANPPTNTLPGSLTLSAPAGSAFINVKFASYGLPGGTSPNFTIGSCHAFNSRTVTTGLLGNNIATIPASGSFNNTFGDPCYGTVKSYNVVATYAEPFCTTSGVPAIVINGSTPTGGNGTYTYLWEISTTGHSTGYAPASGINDAKDYTVPAGTSQTTWYRRTVTSGIYSDATIVIIQVVAVSPTVPTNITAPATICSGSSTTLTVSGGSLGGPGGYAEWSTGSCGATIIGTGSSIVVSPTTTTTYFVRYKNACGSTTCISKTIKVPSIISNKVDETCPVSNNGSISPILSGGISNVKYIKITQKYANYQQVAEIEAFEIFTGTNVARSTNGAIATSSSNYNSTLIPGKAIDGDITGISNNYWHSLTTHVNEWIMITLPANKNIDFLKIYNRIDCCSDRGQNMLLELLDDSSNVLYSKTIDLYQSGANVPVNVNVLDVSWSDSATTLNRTNLDSGTYTLNYADANTCSTNLPVIISSINVNPTITTQPSASSQPYCLNSPALALTVATTGTNVTYQWYINTIASNTGGTLLSGATSANYTPLTTSVGTNYYYCVVSGTCTPAATSSVSGGITVTPLPAAPSASVTTVPSCVTNAGTITISAPLGAGFTYSIDGTTYTNTTGEFTTVPIGTYNVTAKNSSGCISAATPIDVNGAVTKNWTGASGTNWNDPTNWNPNGVPIVSDCVVIPNMTNKPILSGTNASFYANTLQVDGNAIVTVQSTNILSVTNSVTVATNGQLIFENNASLVQTNNVINTGSIIYNRNSAPMKNFDYTYWASPVAGQTLFDLSPNTLADKYMSYSGTGWQVLIGGTAVMQPGIGYIIRTPKGGTWPAPHPEVVSFPYSQPVQFIGVPNNGNITSGQSLLNGKFYLVGNPYPSALNADDFLFNNTNNHNVLNGTIYLWTHNTAVTSLKYTSDDYASYNGLGGVATSGGAVPSGYIAAGQSFFASAKANGNAAFDNSMRPTGNNTQFFKPGKTSKTAKLEKHRLWLNMTNTTGAFKQTLIGYAEGATNNFDNDFDGLTFDGNSYLDLYSINGTDNLTIQGRALPFTDTDLVPLGYRSTVAGSFTIAINQADGALANQRIYLEDKQTNTINDLTAQNYTFSTTVGTFNNRFVLRYTNKTLGTGDFENVENSVTVTSQDKTIVISSPTENIDKVFIYDISGKQLYKKQSVGNAELSIQHLPFAQQVLLVKIVLENGYTTTKKLIFK